MSIKIVKKEIPCDCDYPMPGSTKPLTAYGHLLKAIRSSKDVFRGDAIAFVTFLPRKRRAKKTRRSRK
jgi:hypothetical protein